MTNTPSGRAPSGQALVASDQAASRLAPTGFDPSRIDGKQLAVLLWDYFGPNWPKTPEQIKRGGYAAGPDLVNAYHSCAWDIIASLERGK